MARKPAQFNESELAVLEVLWRRGAATIREITDEIYTRRTAGEYATVQKLLERMENKDFVSRDRSAFAHSFTASVSRAELVGRGVQSLAEKLCDGSLTPVLTHLIQGNKLSRKDLKVLRRLIDDAE